MTAYKTLLLRTDRVPTLIKAALGATCHPHPDRLDFGELVGLFHEHLADEPVTAVSGWVACDGTHNLLLWDRDPTVGTTRPESYLIPALSVACPVCGANLETTPSAALTCAEYGAEHFRVDADEPLLEGLALAGLRAKR